MPLETVWQLPFVVASRPQSGLTRAGTLAFHAFGGWTFDLDEVHPIVPDPPPPRATYEDRGGSFDF